MPGTVARASQNFWPRKRSNSLWYSSSLDSMPPGSTAPAIASTMSTGPNAFSAVATRLAQPFGSATES